jgi:branched-chain amino acid transport system ATP-binding protein
MSALTVSGLNAGYGKTPVVHDVTLSIDQGEIVALIGRNGAGKSTTLMSIAGFLPNASGDVRIDGKKLHGPPHRRAVQGLGLVLEGRSVFPSLSVRENLALAGADVAQSVDYFPELEPLLDRRAGLLSGGEQQMVALARAIGRKPQVLLADELSFGLAPRVCLRLLEILGMMAKDLGTAVLFVEQHLHLVATAATRILVMRRGEIALELGAQEFAKRTDEVEALYLGESSLSEWS